MEVSMRLPVLSPAALRDEQKPLYEDMRKGIKSYFGGFESVCVPKTLSVFID
jgi:hypothetical protein